MESKSKRSKRKSKSSESSSPKKLKSNNDSDHELDDNDNDALALQADMDNSFTEIEWTTEELNTLIELVGKTVTKNDKCKYQTSVNKIKWNEIIVPPHSSEECKQKWFNILENVRKFRTLTEICADAKQWAKKPWTTYKKKDRHPDLPKKPVTPYLRFYVEKIKQFREKNPSAAMQSVSSEIAAKYNSLSEKKKKKYIDAYNSEMDEWRQKMQKFREEHPGVAVTAERTDKVEGPEKAKSPFIFFKLKRMKKFDESTSKKVILEALRKEWNDLPNKKKCKFIEKALKDEKRYLEEAEEYRNTHPDYVIITKSPVSRAELEMLKTRDGKPEKPPASGYALFSKIMLKEVKDCPSKEKMAMIAQRWKALSNTEKADYNFKAAKQTARYVDKFQKYLDSLSEEEKHKEISDSKMKLPTDKKLRNSLEHFAEADSTRAIEFEANDSDDSD